MLMPAYHGMPPVSLEPGAHPDSKPNKDLLQRYHLLQKPKTSLQLSMAIYMTKYGIENQASRKLRWRGIPGVGACWVPEQRASTESIDTVGIGGLMPTSTF